MQILKKLDELISSSVEKDNKRLAIGIASTSFQNDVPYFSLPRPIHGWGHFVHIVCSSNLDGEKILKHVGEKADNLFLDMEYKNPNFKPRKIIQKFPELKFISYYPNEITVQSIIDIISENHDKDFFLFGHGNLCFRLANFLYTTRQNFKWHASRCSNSINYQRMHFNFKKHEAFSIDLNCDIILNMSSYNSEEFNNKLINFNGLVIDIGGKGAIDMKLDTNIKLLNINERLVQDISFRINQLNNKKHYGRILGKDGEYYVSGGFKGLKGDLVVDDCFNPTYLLGIADGRGGFMRRVNLDLEVFKNKVLK